jgi:hypothetical protein
MFLNQQNKGTFFSSVGNFTFFPSPTLHSIKLYNDEIMMNRKGFGRKWSRYNLGTIPGYPGIYLQEVRKITKNIRQGGRDSNPAPPEYDSGVLPLRQPGRYTVSFEKSLHCM